MDTLFWDMDGVLIDSLGLDFQVVNPMLVQRFGPEVQVSREFIRERFALAIPDFIRAILEEVARFDPDICEAMVREYEALRRSASYELCPGVLDRLEEARALGFSQWVVSNNLEADIDRILKQVGIRDYFDGVRGYDSSGVVAKKPAPDIYLSAFEEAGSTDRFWVVEDSEMGVASAVGARELWAANSVMVVGVATGGDTPDCLVKADRVVCDLSEFSFVTMEMIYEDLVQGREMEAARALSWFLATRFGFKVEALKFQQSAVSLNSFKGVFVSEGQRYFFKTHIESGSEVSEYAGAQMLEKAGYPVMTPVFVSNEQGRELLVYPFVEEPSLFELVCERRVSEEVRRAQTQLDRQLFGIYKKTFRVEKCPEFPAVQQLFYRRLTGSRFRNFYEGTTRELGGRQISFEDLEAMEFVVNGVSCGVMEEWLVQARRWLAPESQLPFTVIGHGDAHNGNLFYGKEGLRYFDPAYAGRMDPFLDLAKPLFHNTWARWMYFPEEVEASSRVNVCWEAGRILIDYDVALNEVEQFFFASKMREVVGPLLNFLRQKDCLPLEWENRLRSALLCCPLLTVNLFDEAKYSPAMAAFGLARVAEMATFNFNPYLS